MRVLAVLLLLTACATGPESAPASLPSVAVGYSGAPSGGTRLPPRALELVAWRGHWEGGHAADTQAIAVAADRGAPFRGTDPGLIGLRVGSGAPAPETSANRAAAIVGDDVTTVISLPGSDMPALHLRLQADGLRAALCTRPSAARSSVHVDLGVLPLSADGTACLAGAPDPDGERLVLSLHLGPDAAPAAVASARAEVAVARADARPRPTGASWPDRLPSIAVGEGPRRGALLACAVVHGLTRLVDFVLAADEPLLIAVADAIPPRPSDAFAVERAAFAVLLPAVQRGQVNPATTAAMRRHFGALADDATTIEFLLADVADAAAFAAAIRSANVDALDDRGADRRIDAATWLATRGTDLDGYDAFAPRDERRAFVRRLAAGEVGR